jgi:hypothetical protein
VLYPSLIPLLKPPYGCSALLIPGDLLLRFIALFSLLEGRDALVRDRRGSCLEFDSGSTAHHQSTL